MDLCYVDESGSSDLLCATTPTSTPVLVIAGLIVPDGHLKDLVWDFLQLKKRFNPSLADPSRRLSDVIAAEVKGSDLRADVRSGSTRRTSRAIGIITNVFRLLEKHQCQLVAKARVKTVDTPVEDRAVYGASIGWICGVFHRYLEERDQQGLVILDSRTKVKNTPNTHVVTTQIYRHGGNPLPRLVEVPLFGHSDSHVALQITDIIASAVIFPATCSAFCSELTWNHHSHPLYEDVRWRFGGRLQKLQFRFYDETLGVWKGGIHTLTSAGGLPAHKLFSSDRRPPSLPGIPPAAPTPEHIVDGVPSPVL